MTQKGTVIVYEWLKMIQAKESKAQQYRIRYTIRSTTVAYYSLQSPASHRDQRSEGPFTNVDGLRINYFHYKVWDEITNPFPNMKVGLKLQDVFWLHICDECNPSL